MPDAIRVAVIDDHPMFREGAVQILACLDDIEVVAEGATAADALRVAEELRPDVMLLDIGLPGNGLEAAAGIARTFPTVRAVILRRRRRAAVRCASLHPEREQRRRGCRSGARRLQRQIPRGAGPRGAAARSRG